MNQILISGILISIETVDFDFFGFCEKMFNLEKRIHCTFVSAIYITICYYYYFFLLSKFYIFNY